jgi:threonine synthase
MNTPMQQKQVSLQCVSCGQEYPLSFRLRCDTCNSLVDPVYSLESVQILDSPKPLERYFFLIPLERLSSALYLGEGNTPCVHVRNLGERVGMHRLYLKDESPNPTRTTKDRTASCVLSQFRELGIKEFVATSTGNSSTSFAFGVQKLTDMKVHLFCGKAFLDRHAYYDHPHVRLHVVDGDFVSADVTARQFAREHGLIFEGGFSNLARREGLKLAYLEAFDQLPDEPAVIVQAVSSGMGLYGAYRGVREYQQLGRLRDTPRFVCAQQESCAPMYQAFIEDSDAIRPHHIIHNPSGIAEAILRGDPSQSYPYMYDIVKATNGCFVAASQDEIVEARTLPKETEGIDVCYASATALAAALLLHKRGWIEATEPVLVNLTGGVRSSEERNPSAINLAD